MFSRCLIYKVHTKLSFLNISLDFIRFAFVQRPSRRTFNILADRSAFVKNFFQNLLKFFLDFRSIRSHPSGA